MHLLLTTSTNTGTTNTMTGTNDDDRVLECSERTLKPDLKQTILKMAITHSTPGKKGNFSKLPPSQRHWLN